MSVLMNMTLTKVVNFHGHLCPDLVIGCKVCEYARELFTGKENFKGVIVENCTSAIDAVQALLGFTLGNHRLIVFDFGKHNYTFSQKNEDKSFRLSLKVQQYGDENEYEEFETKMKNNQASLNETIYYQKLIENRVQQLLDSHFNELFVVEDGSLTHPTVELPVSYSTCWGCGQQVMKSRAIELQERIYCYPCSKELVRLSCIQNIDCVH